MVFKQVPYEDVEDICEAAVDIMEKLKKNFPTWQWPPNVFTPVNIYNISQPHFTHTGQYFIRSYACCAWICACLKLNKDINDVLITTGLSELGFTFGKVIELHCVDTWLQVFTDAFDLPEYFLKGLSYLNPCKVKEKGQLIDHMIHSNKSEFVMIFLRWLEESSQIKETNYRL